MSLSPFGRIVEIAEDGRHLAKQRGFVVVSAAGTEVGRVPLDDIAAVIATSPATTTSCALLADLAERGIPFVFCGRNYAPAGLLWPVAGHHAQQRRMEAQLERSRAMAAPLWAEIVRAKIRRQGWAVAQSGHPAGAFGRLARLVQPGDPGNIEAQAARRYWPLLFGKEFRRDPNASGLNAVLNYGYAVLRGAAARSIAAAGLHPGIGIFHRHPHNAMPLADDLMEPFRPVVDLLGRTLWLSGSVELTPDRKRTLAGVLGYEEHTEFGRSPLSTCLIRLAASLAESFLVGRVGLALPFIGNGRMSDPEDA